MEAGTSQAHRLSDAALQGYILALIDELIADLVGAKHGEHGEVAGQHAWDRIAKGNGIAEAFRELSVLRDEILALFVERGLPIRPEVMRVLHASIDARMSASARACAEELRAQGEALSEREERLQAVLRSAADPIITTDERGIIDGVNEATERLFGYRAEEMIGRNVSMLMPEPDRSQHDEYVARYLRTGQRRIIGTVREVLGQRKDGTIFPTDLAVNEARVNGRRFFVGIHHDVTERRHAEKEREHLLTSERSARAEAERATRTRDEFVATVSHELRTPLNAILGWTAMLRSGRLDAATTAKALEVVERNARAQTQLVDDLLDVSRLGSGKLRIEPHLVEVASVIEDMVNSQLPSAQAKRVHLAAVIGPGKAVVRGDAGRIEQIVLNLITNAIKFTPEGGRVEVCCREDGTDVEIAVRDTGKGISADFLPYVFDRFRQADASIGRQHRGLGLGLALVKSLVELHGGTVRAESEGPGRGATFTVRLPRVQPGENEDDQGVGVGTCPADACASLAEAKILVVDDDEDARTLVCRILEECHAVVAAVGSAADALSVLPVMRPDAMICDISMPGMDGYQLIRSVRALPEESGGGTLAVALTACALPEDRRRALRAGYQAHLAKPIDPVKLVVTLANVIGRLERRAS